MKIGLISDIHSNVIALEACIRRLEEEGCDEFVLLGDYVSDTPYPAETMARIRKLMADYPCLALRGNREDYQLAQQRIRNGEEDGPLWLANSASGNLLFTYERLTESDFSFFRQLPASLLLEKEGLPPILCCHGSPTNTRELLQLDGENTRAWLEQLDTDVLIAGHTHFQGTIVHAGKQLINPGSCGIAIDDVGNAQCALIDADGGVWHPHFFSVPYDACSVIRDIFDSGLQRMAHWFINNNLHTIIAGIDISLAFVDLAARLQREADSSIVWPNIEEHIYAQAAEQLGMPDYGSMSVSRLCGMLEENRKRR